MQQPIASSSHGAAQTLLPSSPVQHPAAEDKHASSSPEHVQSDVRIVPFVTLVATLGMQI